MLTFFFWLIVMTLFLWGLKDLLDERHYKLKAERLGKKLHDEIDEFLKKRGK
jgi:hypothetical protein